MESVPEEMVTVPAKAVTRLITKAYEYDLVRAYSLGVATGVVGIVVGGGIYYTLDYVDKKLREKKDRRNREKILEFIKK